MKNVLLLLLHISTQAGHEAFAREMLLSFKAEFGKTLTFCSEIYKYTQMKDIFPQDFLLDKLRGLDEKWTKSDDQLIWSIN